MYDEYETKQKHVADRCDWCANCFRRMQIILWSCIGGSILIILLICLYIKSNNYDCKGPIFFKYVLCWLYTYTIWLLQ